MKHLVVVPIALVANLWLCMGLAAHGGTYRGPGSSVPPSQGSTGNSKSTAGSSGSPQAGSTQGGATTTPLTSGTPIPTSGGTTTAPPNAGRRGPAGGGYYLSPDYSSWTYWWGYNKGIILNLKARFRGEVASGPPSEQVLGRGRKTLRTVVLPPNVADRKQIRRLLVQTLADPDESVHVISSCIMALAKIGHTPGMNKILRPFLRSSNQEIRETAALALGLSGDTRLLPDLVALAEDQGRAHKTLGRSKIDFRTRSFACYGLGKLVGQHDDSALANKVFQPMKRLAEDQTLRRDIRVAALYAMAQIRIGKGPAWEKLSKEILDFLIGHALDESSAGHRGSEALITNHALTSLASVRGREPAGPGYRHQILAGLVDDRMTPTPTLQSAMIALGQLSRPEDKKISEWIQHQIERNRDLHVRHMATMALGQIGGEVNRSYLRKRLRKVANRLEKPWLALSIAALYQGSSLSSFSEDMKRADAELLLTGFKKEKNRMAAAGFAIALGQMDHREAAETIRDRLRKIRKDDEPASYLCLSLGMLGDQDSRELLTELFEVSHRRTTMVVQTSIALALLGDSQIQKRLLDKLSGKKTIVTVYGSLSQALGQLGDRRSIEPLLTLLEDEANPALVRAFSVVSLGLIGSKEVLPWNARMAANGNYMANFETLTGSTSGILDIL